MVYDGFVVIDTRDVTGTESNYDTPALPGGGGSTAPSYGPLPGLGGAGYNPQSTSTAPESSTSDGGGGGWQQWVNPQTIGASMQLFGSVANAVAAGKTADTAEIKAVCGRKPLLNIGGKKDKYFQCTQNLIASKQQPIYMPQAQTGMSTGTKVLIGVVIFVVLVAIIIAIIMMAKKAKGGEAVTK